jgi:hypothetical protein
MTTGSVDIDVPGAAELGARDAVAPVVEPVGPRRTPSASATLSLEIPEPGRAWLAESE